MVGRIAARAMDEIGNNTLTGWRRSLAAYADRRVLLILPLGFASGLPLLLTFSTLSAWLATAGVSRAAIGAFALVGTPLRVQVPVVAADRSTAAADSDRAAARMGNHHPDRTHRRDARAGFLRSKAPPGTMGALALLVAFLSASQDIVIDAWRVEILAPDQQGPGAGMIQTGYRIAMLVAGAGALMIAARAGWFAAYATMAALLAVGMLVFLFGPEPKSPVQAAAPVSRPEGAMRSAQWLATAVVGPFADFMRRPSWPAILSSSSATNWAKRWRV